MYGWMRQLPVVGFNSGKYDLNAIKQFLIPYFLTTSKTDVEQDEAAGREGAGGQRKVETDGIGSMFVIKRNNTFMCLSTDQLKFVDMINYIAPGFSYDKYLKAYGCGGDERSFPVRVHGQAGETRRHRTSTERGLLQSTEERRDFRRGLRQLSGGLARQWHDDVARLSRLVQQQGRGSLSTGHRQTVRVLSTTGNRHVQARYQRTRSDPAVPVQRPAREDLLYHLQREEQRPARPRQREYCRRAFDHLSSLSRDRGHTLRRNEYGEAARPCRAIVGYDANALYLWSLMQDMPMGWYTATTSGEGLPPRIGAAVRTDGRRMVDVGIRTHGTVQYGIRSTDERSA